MHLVCKSDKKKAPSKLYFEDLLLHCRRNSKLWRSDANSNDRFNTRHSFYLCWAIVMPTSLKKYNPTRVLLLFALLCVAYESRKRDRERMRNHILEALRAKIGVLERGKRELVVIQSFSINAVILVHSRIASVSIFFLTCTYTFKHYHYLSLSWNINIHKYIYIEDELYSKYYLN